MRVFRTSTKVLRLLCLIVATNVFAVAADPEPRPDGNRDFSRRTTGANQGPGSALFFDFYSSDAGNSATRDTEFTVTNTSASESTLIHLLLFEGASGGMADAFFYLSPNETFSFLASVYDPAVTGYAMVVASDLSSGCPISFNYLVGSANVKLPSGHAARLNATSHRALFNGALPECSPSSGSVTMNFDGAMYTMAPRTLAVDRIFHPLDGNSALVIVNKFGGDWTTNITGLTGLSGEIFDHSGNVFVFSAPVNRLQFIGLISDNFPRTAPRVTEYLTRGKTGWMRLKANNEQAISGVIINFNPDAATMTGRFSGGQNLHSLEYTRATLTIPLSRP
jgi:hypothetical protein